MAGHVYAVGGFNGSLRVRTVDVYDGVKDQWTSIASMQERRSTLGAAVLNDLLYAVGGFDGSTGRSRSCCRTLFSGHSCFAQSVLGLVSIPCSNTPGMKPSDIVRSPSLTRDTDVILTQRTGIPWLPVVAVSVHSLCGSVVRSLEMAQCGHVKLLSSLARKQEEGERQILGHLKGHLSRRSCQFPAPLPKSKPSV